MSTLICVVLALIAFPLVLTEYAIVGWTVIAAFAICGTLFYLEDRGRP